MMRRLMACVMALAMFSASAPVHAEPTPVRPTPAPTRPALPPRPAANEPSVAQVENLIGQVGMWSAEYSAHLTAATEIMNAVDGFTAILDRFSVGDLRTRAALEELEAWRVNSIEHAQTVRARASTLRAPPSMALMGEQGTAIEGALAVARSDLAPLIDETIVSIESLAAFGAEAIRSPTKAFDARRRAVYTSAVQLVRIDERRIRASVLALPDDHPNRALMESMLHYYAAVSAMPTHELGVLNGGTADPGALAATMRQATQAMRTSLAQADSHAQTSIRAMRDTPVYPGTENLRRVVLEMSETFPASVNVYGRLANTLDTAAASIAGGGDVITSWADQETQSLPLFEEATVYENRRIELAAQLRR